MILCDCLSSLLLNLRLLRRRHDTRLCLSRSLGHALQLLHRSVAEETARGVEHLSVDTAAAALNP
jgi:hypothetical protein